MKRFELRAGQTHMLLDCMRRATLDNECNSEIFKVNMSINVLNKDIITTSYD